MQEQLEEQVHVGCKDIENMQIMMKGKRTKRQRLPSPLRLNMSSISSSSTENSGLIASSIDEFRKRSILSDQEEENDMANCLILLAQGHHHHHHTQKASHHNNNNLGLYLNYQCKTCNRCFPSFQALGGHRASHKKPKVANTTDQEKQLASAVTTTTAFVGDHDHDHDHDQYPTNTTLTLQLYSTNNRALYTNNSSTTTTTSTIKSKVHECSICGAEFTSGQALGGHMRRHRSRTSLMISTSTATTTMSTDHGVVVNGHGGSPETQQAKAPRNALKLDLNLPAPEDDNNSREPKFPFQPKDKVIVFSATSLVDCHY